MISFPRFSPRMPQFSGSSSRSVGTELSHQKSDASLKRHWKDEMDQRLQQTSRGDSIALKNEPQEEKWFLELYGQKFPLKRQEYQNLLRKEIELKKKLKNSKTLTGRLSQWATAGGASLGAIADLVVHIPSLGVSLLMIPPGTITAAGTAMGRIFQGKSPGKISYELHEVESARQEVGAYLSNLQTGLNEVGQHRNAKKPPPEPKRQYQPRRRGVERFDVIG